MLLGVHAKSNKQKMCSVSVFMNYFDNPGGMIPTRLVNWAAKVGSHTLFEYIRFKLAEGGSNWETQGVSNWEATGLVQSKLWKAQ